jgi:hypothetical protein
MYERMLDADRFGGQDIQFADAVPAKIATIIKVRKRKMDEKEAIRKCKKFWHDIEDSGLSKEGYLVTHPEHEAHSWHDECPLCEIVRSCIQCPLYKQYGVTCSAMGYSLSSAPTRRWLDCVYGLKVVKS